MTTRQPKKKRRLCSPETEAANMFDVLPDDLIVSILCKLSSSSSSPAEFFSVLMTCKRLNELGRHPLVLSRAGPETLAVKAKNWSESAHSFLKLCINAGNIEACYALGMIRFYCLHNRASGASLMAKAAIKRHPHALYSLAVIQFNGSGGSKTDKNLHAGVALCARAAVRGHIDAIRELGHCLQDGYGVPPNAAEGRRLLIQANARELAFCFHAHFSHDSETEMRPPTLIHPVNRFMREWFVSGFGSGLGRAGLQEGLRICTYEGCGRPETRIHEFRRCSVCGKVNYCSRGCQALDWRVKHKLECVPAVLWVAPVIGGGDAAEIENVAGR